MSYDRASARSALLLAALCFASVWMPEWSLAGENDWIITGVNGGATVTDADGASIAPRSNVTMPTGVRIKIGGGGQMRLKRGKTVLLVERNSDIELREQSDQGRVTIFQRLGEIILDVEPRRQRHFEVETPHLTAVVKGTEFAVAVAATGSSVLVKEGVVEVTSLVTGQSTLVGPSQSARVASGLSGRQCAQAGSDDLAGASTPHSIAPSVGRSGSNQGSSGFGFPHLDLGDIGLTVGVALASILAILIAVSDAFATRCRNLAGRVFQANRSKPRS